MADDSARAPAKATERLRFGAFILDPVTGELWKGEEPVDVPPQPMRLLAMLAGRPGRLVTRGEIREEIWGDTVVEFDQAINNAVRQVRGALGDDARDPVYVETVPRRGYRFVAPLETEARERPQGGRTIAGGRFLLGAVAGVVLIAIGAAVWSSGPMVSQGEPVTVAVVQTRAVIWEPTTESFATTLTADLTEALQTLQPRDLSVVPWTWDMAVTRDGRVTRGGEPVDVDFAVDSNIRVEDGWKAAVIVTKLPEGQQVWYRRFAVDPADPVQEVSRISRAVAGAIAKNLMEGRR